MSEQRRPGDPRPWWFVVLRQSGALVLVAAAAVGCSSEPGRPAADGADTDAPSERSSRLEEFATEAQNQAEDLDATRPGLREFRAAADEIARMEGRSIAASEYGRVMLSCLRDAGFDGARFTQDGEGLDATFRNDLERDGYNLVLSACEQRFPAR